MATQLLLLKDVESLGRSGELVNVKPGYARNFLIPQQLAMLPNRNTKRLQERLQEERLKKAALDKSESEAIAARVEGITLTQVVKVDHEGHMYGSVSVADILHLLKENANVDVEKKSVLVKHAIKKTGKHSIALKLKEEVTASFNLNVISEEESRKPAEEQDAPSEE